MRETLSEMACNENGKTVKRNGNELRTLRTISRHENGPLYESRRHYLEHLAAQGATRRTIRGAAEVIYRAATCMRLDSSSPVERTDVEQAAKDWANRPFGNANLIAPGHAMKEFRLITCGWLRFAGRLKEPGRAKRESSACVLLCRLFGPNVCALTLSSCPRTSRAIGRSPAKCATSSNGTPT